MADVVPVSTPKNTPKPKTKKLLQINKSKVNHPPTALMVNSAIETLKERGGSSLHVIKKYIAATYKIDAENFSAFIKKYLKNSVTSGSLIQTKGIGASGSFKFASTANSKKSADIKSKEAKTTDTKKAAVVKKFAKAAKKPVATKANKLKSPSKAKSTSKVPTKKSKSRKPKVIKSTSLASPWKK